MKTWKEIVNEKTESFLSSDKVTVSFDAAHEIEDFDAKKFQIMLKKKMTKYKVKIVKFNENGPGGWPEVKIQGKYSDVIDYLTKEYDEDFADDVKDDPAGMGMKKV